MISSESFFDAVSPASAIAIDAAVGYRHNRQVLCGVRIRKGEGLVSLESMKSVFSMYIPVLSPR